jgi:hypothetical protein
MIKCVKEFKNENLGNRNSARAQRALWGGVVIEITKMKK